MAAARQADFPSVPWQRCHRRLRTSNAIKRVHQELKRRTRVAALFSNEASLLRLISALLMEISEDRQTSKCYLSPPKTTRPSHYYYKNIPSSSIPL